MSNKYSIHALEEYSKSSNMFAKLRSKLLESLKQAGVAPNSVIALKGTVQGVVNDTDEVYEIRYESFTFNLTGIKDTDYFILIEIDSSEVHVFVSPFDEIIQTFLVPLTPESITSQYGFKSYYTSKLSEVLATINPSCIYINKGTNSDSGVSIPTSFLSLPEFQSYNLDEAKLYPCFAKCRSIKTPEEIEVMRRVIQASSEGHIAAMQHCKPGLYEYSLAGVFRSHISINYGYHYSFTPISASGKSAAVLHYPYMDKPIAENSLVLCDMGGYGFGYCSDIACTFPANGKYSENQAQIYNIVLKANRAVISTMRPGSEWTDMHLLAEKIIIEGLIEIGILQGDANEIQEKRIGAVFFPHGLGHFLGHDTHDVGGYICGHARSTEPGIKCLRTRRTLEEGMVITVEPGCYFIDFVIERALADPETQKYFTERIREFRDFGGVRIEDDVLVTREGAEILTDVPREVQDVEAVMAGGDWQSIKKSKGF